LPATGEIIPADMATPSPDDGFHRCTYFPTNPIANEFEGSGPGSLSEQTGHPWVQGLRCLGRRLTRSCQTRQISRRVSRQIRVSQVTSPNRNCEVPIIHSAPHYISFRTPPS